MNSDEEEITKQPIGSLESDPAVRPSKKDGRSKIQSSLVASNATVMTFNAQAIKSHDGPVHNIFSTLSDNNNRKESQENSSRDASKMHESSMMMQSWDGAPVTSPNNLHASVFTFGGGAITPQTNSLLVLNGSNDRNEAI